MKILFVTSYGYLPDVVGGLQTTIHELCQALVVRGLHPTLLCGTIATLNKEHFCACSDEILGYPVIRVPDSVEALHTVAAAVEPDAIVVLTGDNTAAMAIAALDTEIPVAVYIHNVEFREFGGILLPDPQLCYFSNSHFTARRLHALFGLESTVLIPLVDPEMYTVDSSKESILFINPSLLKGVEIFFQVAARLPDYPFRVFESWNITSAWRRYCHSRITKLPNVEWNSPTRDVTTLYGSARLLIMPSIWEEAYGRSALEAQLNGIPVIASRRGGLPEAVGDGGILLDADVSADTWVKAIRSVFSDQELYQKLSNQALQHVSQVEMSSDFIVATLLTTLQKHISSTN